MRGTPLVFHGASVLPLHVFLERCAAFEWSSNAIAGSEHQLAMARSIASSTWATAIGSEITPKAASYTTAPSRCGRRCSRCKSPWRSVLNVSLEMRGDQPFPNSLLKFFGIERLPFFGTHMPS